MTDDVDRFRRIIARCAGLTLDITAPDVLADLLAERAAATGLPPAAYLDGLAADRCRAELPVLAPRLTVPETYFFRNSEQFRALAEVALPALARQHPGRPLRLLSAGCATGEEAYTLAMVAHDTGRPVSVVGVDVNPAVLERARRGRYSEWSMRATPAPMRRRWFRPAGEGVAVDQQICDAVRFVVGDLADDDAAWWAPGGYDVIFCRNVIIYHTPEYLAAAVSRLVQALAPGGFLFLGHAETAHGRVDGLELKHSHETFYFRRTGHSAPTANPEAAPTAAPAAPPTVPWKNPKKPKRPTARTGDEAVARALDLLRQERFDDALALVNGVPGAAAQLVRAALLADLGRLGEAEAECRALLDADGLHAGAHYLLAVTREGAGDPSTAWSHARTAAYLDPGFAMPRLRLGLLARGRDDRTTARHEFAAALTLLAGESTDRVLLFGGGFTRTALADLCRTELRACGAAA